jgi:hypothetical protein
MANPNIVNVSQIYGKTTGVAIGTAATTIVTNAAASGKIVKVNSLYIANIDGTSAADVTVEIFKNGATAYKIASTISVPADATLVIISKDAGIYLEENDTLRALASVAGDLEALCSYEEIS